MEAGILGKTAVCLVGGGGVVFAGCYAGGIIKFGSAQWTTLLQDSDNFKANYSTVGKIGKDYGQYLVDTKKNEGWWKESHEQYKKDIKDSSAQSSLSTNFGTSVGITSAYSQSDSKALNKVCEFVYSQDTALISFESSDDSKYKLGRDLLKYCSPLGQSPTIISGYDSGTIGSTGHSNKLVSTQDSKNKGFWEAQQKWFENLGSGVTDQYFSKFFEGKNGSKTLKENENIKDICDGAYGKQTSTTDSTDTPTTDNVIKYCTFAKLATSGAGS